MLVIYSKKKKKKKDYDTKITHAEYNYLTTSDYMCKGNKKPDAKVT